MALQYKTEIESILSDVKKMNLLDFYYQMDSEYHINSGDLKEALKSIHQSLFYKNNIQEYLSEETPDEKLLSYRNNKLKSENNDLRLRQNYFIYLLFILLVSLSLVYFLLKRKRLHNQYELERRIEILEKIAEEKESDTLELKNILIRDFEITKRIALLKNLHVHKDQSIVDKINNLLIIDDKNSFEIEWNDFYERVNISYDKFYTFLKSHYYNMNEKEIQLCCMMRIGFKTDEIAAVWNQSVFSVQKCRSSIRKKIGTGEGADIISFIETEMNQ